MFTPPSSFDLVSFLEFVFFFAGCSVEEGFGAGLSVMQISLPCRTVEAQKHLKAHPLEKHLDECCLEDFIT